MNKILNLLTKLSGYKTYVVGISAIVWGLHTSDINTVILGLGLVGLRNGVTTEIAKLAVK